MPIVTCGITDFGPLADMRVGQARAGLPARHQRGQAAPQPIETRGLIDTGSTYTFIDHQMAVALGLVVTGYTAVSTVTPGSSDYFMELHNAAVTIFGHAEPIEFPLALDVACDLTSLGVGAVIGRDILDLCLVHYNGPAGICTIAA